MIGVFPSNHTICASAISGRSNNTNNKVGFLIYSVKDINVNSVSTTINGERVILSFGGDKPFTLIEETISVSKELDINLSYGEPDLIIDTVGIINDYEIPTDEDMDLEIEEDNYDDDANPDDNADDDLQDLVILDNEEDLDDSEI